MSTATSNKRIGIISTTAYHLAFVFLLFILMQKCGSPGEGTQYIGLNVAALGDPDAGSSETESEESASSSESQPEQEPVVDESVDTQDDSPITKPKTEDKPKKDPVEKPEKPKPEKPKEVSNPLNDALDELGKDKKDDKGENDTGPKGSKDGVITGKGVLGGGNGGSGYEFSFTRNMAVQPSLDEKPKDDGTVVVDIWVDKNGNVVKAQANPSHAKTNTSNADLYRLAEKAAKNAKFKSDPDVTGNQKGTITINFKLV